MNAITASGFVESIGVNTHFGYSGTPYVDRFEEVCAKLDELGVLHIRDGGPVQHTKASGIDYRHMDKIWERLRKQPCDILHVLAPHDVYDSNLEGKKDAAGKEVYPYRQDYGRTDIAVIRHALGDKVIAWEGLNEPDGKVPFGDWAAKTLAFQKVAEKDLKAETIAKWGFDDPSLSCPLLLPAIGHPWDPAPYSSLGFKLWDYGNTAAAHFYAGTEPPENSKTLANLKLLRRYSAELPIWVTECGYDTAGLASSVSEEQQAAYLLQTLFLHPSLGIDRTYIYELVDQKPTASRETRLGLLRYDLTEKPAFTLLKSAIRSLSAEALPAGVQNP